MLPEGLRTVLDIGARDGHFSRLLTEHFERVTALDLTRPEFYWDRVETVAGDVTHLDFPDRSFDCVFCTEVLEHIPALQRACREIARVARWEIVIGVPFRQDLRVARTTCAVCGRISPPWGHVNRFTEERLRGLFPGWHLRAKSFVGITREATNPVSALLMDLGGNPWGTYGQEEPCIHCGNRLQRPGSRTLAARVCCSAAACLTRVQQRMTTPHGKWIHVAFSRSA